MMPATSYAIPSFGAAAALGRWSEPQAATVSTIGRPTKSFCISSPFDPDLACAYRVARAEDRPMGVRGAGRRRSRHEDDGRLWSVTDDLSSGDSAVASVNGISQALPSVPGTTVRA